jgi:Cytochrome c oxidase subunit IV
MYSDPPAQPENPATLPATEHGAEEPHLSPLSVWPITCAAGIALGGTGLVTWWPLTALGLVMIFVSIWQWVQELRHEPQHPH